MTTVRHDAEACAAERRAWGNYVDSVHEDYCKAGGRSKKVYVAPSPRTRQFGAAWLASCRERELHTRRRKGA